MRPTVFLATSYPTSASDASGHFVRAEALARAREGVEVHVIAPSPWPGDPGIVAHAAGGSGLFGWPGAAVRGREEPWRGVFFGVFAAGVAYHLRRLDPALVVAHWAVPCGWPLAAPLAPRSAGLEVVSHGADVRLLLALPAPARERIVASLAARASWRFVASSLRARLLGSLSAPVASRLAAISAVEAPAVDVGCRDDREEVPAGRYAVASSRLVAAKRVDLAIAAVALCPGWALVVLGDGPERGSLERLAAAVAPGRVVFLGKVGRPRALGVVARAAALLHPSEEDAAPTVVLEALALGVPVVACAVGDVGAWRRAGLRVVERSAEALAAGLPA